METEEVVISPAVEDSHGLEQAISSTIDSLPAEPSTETPPNSAQKGETPPTGGDQPDPLAEPPKSWSKDKHELWSKLDQGTREYISLREKQIFDGIEQYRTDAQYAKALRDTFKPYEPLLQAQGITQPEEAVRILLNAHYQLSNGEPTTRLQAFANLAQYYGFSPEQLAAHIAGTQQPAADPRISQLEQTVNNMASMLTAAQQRQVDAARKEVSAQVDKFASDPKNIYFNEIGDDILRLIQAGYGLEEAYDKAVWANPATRAKETKRLNDAAIEEERKKAEEKAKAAAKGRGTVVRGIDTGRSPTDGRLGSMDDTMDETLAAIRARTH